MCSKVIDEWRIFRVRHRRGFVGYITVNSMKWYVQEADSGDSWQRRRRRRRNTGNELLEGHTACCTFSSRGFVRRG